MTDLDELIHRLEGASEGSWELDEAIAGWRLGATFERQPDGRLAWHRDGFWVSIQPILPWTTSLDAALTLLPEDASWTVGKWRSSVGGCVEAVYWADVHMGESFAIRHRSATIAVCIGGLKSRAVLGRDVPDGYK